MTEACTSSALIVAEVDARPSNCSSWPSQR